MEKLKISVIIPVYNVAPYIKRCVESLLNQTYSNLEIILIDDGSTDDSGKICDTLRENDSRILCFHKKNGGVSSARNLGLEHASGDLIGFVDPDDWVDKKMYNILANQIVDNKADAAFCFHYEAFEDGKVEDWSVSQETILANREEAMYKAMAWPHQGGGYFTAIWNKLFLRNVIFDNDGDFIHFDSSLIIGEDETWLIQVLCNCKNVVLDHHTLYYWFQRSISATHLYGLTKNRLDEIQAKVNVKNILLQQEVNEKLLYLAETNIFDTVYNLHEKCYKTDQKYRKWFYSLLFNNWRGWNKTHHVSMLGNSRKIINLLLMQFQQRPI